MSRYILNHILCCGTRFTTTSFPTNYILTSNYWRCYSRRNKENFTNNNNGNTNNNNNNNNNNSSLGQTTILVQQGCDIQELPVIMRKIGQDEIVAICSNKIPTSQQLQQEHQQQQHNADEEQPLVPLISSNAIESPTLCPSSSSSSNSLITVIDKNNEKFNTNNLASSSTNNLLSIQESEEIHNQIEQCVTSSGILSIIDGIPDQHLTAEITVFALDKLLHVESIINLKLLENSNEIYMKIIDKIVKDGDTKMLLDTLDILRMFLDLTKTVQKLCDELLIRNSDEMLSIVEICESIEHFVNCKQQNGAEKFWSGLADQERQITDVNIKFIYKILSKLKISRRMVLGVLERKIINVFWQLETPAVVEIMESLVKCQPPMLPLRTMQAIARWFNTNIHAINEQQLETIVQSFTELNYFDQQIEKAIERYVKAKGIKIKSYSLIDVILKYSIKSRSRNPHILNGCCEYFMMHTQKIPPANIKTIVLAIGQLNYQPINHQIQFWKQIEQYLTINFDRIQTEDVIEIMLNCLYVEKYPINFIHRIFNQYFLDKMHSSIETMRLEKLRSDLKLFDTTMSLECNEYKGPMLPKDMSAKSLWQDGRIKRIIHTNIDQLTNILGGVDKFSKCIVLQQLPCHPLYVIDVLIHPIGMGNLWNYNRRSDRNVYVAILIMLPEYYDSTGEHLNGAQTMRIRHFRRLGLRVATLDYDKLAKLRVHANELNKYIVERMREALPALPESHSY